MQELARWQQGMEQLARDFYARTSEAFKDDAAMYQFLQRLRQDEVDHEQLMGEVVASLKGVTQPPESAIKIDPSTMEVLTAPAREAYALLGVGQLSKKKLLVSIVAIEFSEWNDIFFYILEATKGHRSSQQFAALVEVHKERIERFIENLPPELKPDREIHTLPTVWERRVLIIDDNEPFRNFLEAVFSQDALVSKAEDGAVGLALAMEHFFDLIVSDVNMPEMDGIEFYQRLIDAHPDMKNRVLFCSGGLSADQEETLRQTGRPCLEKPFDLGVLDQIAASILGQREERPAF